MAAQGQLETFARGAIHVRSRGYTGRELDVAGTSLLSQERSSRYESLTGKSDAGPSNKSFRPLPMIGPATWIDTVMIRAQAGHDNPQPSISSRATLSPS